MNYSSEIAVTIFSEQLLKSYKTFNSTKRKMHQHNNIINEK